MSSQQLQYLLKVKSPGQKQALRRRLKKLYDHYLLDKPYDSYYLRIAEGYRYHVYCAGTRGVTALVQQTGQDIEQARRRQKNDVHHRYIKHALFLSKFYTCLELALRKRPNLKLHFWKQGREIEDQINPAQCSYPVKAKTFKPDALFCIRDLEDKTLQFFFCEADLSGQMRKSTMLDKYRRYWAYYEQGLYTSQGIKPETGFRVLTFTNNRERAEDLKAIIQEEKPWKDFKNLPGMFYFSHSLWHYDKPQPILAPIWMTPKEKGLYSILE